MTAESMNKSNHCPEVLYAEMCIDLNVVANSWGRQNGEGQNTQIKALKSSNPSPLWLFH